MIARQAHLRLDGHGPFRGGGPEKGSEVVLDAVRDGVVVDGAHVEARVHRLTPVVLGEIHHQLHHGAVVAVRGDGGRVVSVRLALGRDAAVGSTAGADARGEIAAELGGDVERRIRARHDAGRGHRKHRNRRDEAAGWGGGIAASLGARHGAWYGAIRDTVRHRCDDASSIGYRCENAGRVRVRVSQRRGDAGEISRGSNRRKAVKLCNRL